MPKPTKPQDIVQQFKQSEDRVLTLPFDGVRSDVSKHWHDFLERTRWQMLKKSIILGVTRYLHSGPLKNSLLRSIGMCVGKHVFIAATVQFDIQFPELITIEDGAILGMHSHIATHEVTHAHIRLGKVHIGRNALIGGQATVRSGVTVGDNAVVAMRAFVTQDVPPNTLITGEAERKILHVDSAL